MTFTVNGNNLSSRIRKFGYSVTYKKVLGSNSCYTLDGKYHEDVLAWKAVIAVQLIAMNDTNVRDIQALFSQAEVQVTFYDTRLGSDRISKFRPTLGTVAHAYIRRDGSNFWSGTNGDGTAVISLTLEEN